MVLEGELSDKQRRCLELVKRSADSLLTVINDILDVSKIEAGKLVLANVAFSFRDCLQNTLDVFRHQADDKGIDLTLRIHPDVPDSLTGDPGRLRQILTNLVGNALKFTERGWIALDVMVVSESDGRVELAFAVADTGVGISEDKQALVFEAFEQADGPAFRKCAGTGLGLAISTQLVEMMGGKISLESRVDHGSTFRFTAVFGTTAPRGSHAHDESAGGSLAGCRVLVVAASSSDAILAEQALTELGAHSTCVDQGAEALAEAHDAAKEDNPYQAVLLDSNIPDMVSFDVARSIRQMPDLPQTAIIMISSVGLRGDAERCREVGIAAYLVRPFDRAQLQEVITAAMVACSKGPAGELITRHTLREHQNGLRILVAEDNYVNREHATMLLEKWGHEVVCVGNGRLAVASHAAESFDLILMDMEMPEMDGLAAAAAIRAAEGTSTEHVPIIAMTANVLDSARDRCRAAGMEGYVSKPMSGQTLLRAIEEVIAPGHGQAPGDVAPAGTEEQAAAPAPAREAPTWDAEEALGHVDGDPEALRRLARSFLADSPGVMAEMYIALERRDGEGLRRLGHKFKGSLGLMGAGLSRSLAEDVETAGRNADWITGAQVVVMLDRELRALQTRLLGLIEEKQTCES